VVVLENIVVMLGNVTIALRGKMTIMDIISVGFEVV